MWISAGSHKGIKGKRSIFPDLDIPAKKETPAVPSPLPLALPAVLSCQSPSAGALRHASAAGAETQEELRLQQSLLLFSAWLLFCKGICAQGRSAVGRAPRGQAENSICSGEATQAPSAGALPLPRTAKPGWRQSRAPGTQLQTPAKAPVRCREAAAAAPAQQGAETLLGTGGLKKLLLHPAPGPSWGDTPRLGHRFRLPSCSKSQPSAGNEGSRHQRIPSVTLPGRAPPRTSLSQLPNDGFRNGPC